MRAVAVLQEDEWTARRRAHERRVDAWTAPHLERRRRGIRHPVSDFLFDYYQVRPAVLRRWHPGAGVTLAGPAAAGYLSWRGYVAVDDGVTHAIGPDEGERRDAEAAMRLLRATRGRPARHDCFALHEWAMVYEPQQRRHAAWPLRVDEPTLRETIAEVGLRCSHIDAFRFFAPTAMPLNSCRPTRATQAELDQPGCLHVNMDLYRWAARFAAFVGSDLVADCFAHAIRLRDLDMQAAPYELSALDVVPIRVESPEGRAQFAARQRELAETAAPLRGRLVEALERVLAADTTVAHDLGVAGH